MVINVTSVLKDGLDVILKVPAADVIGSQPSQLVSLSSLFQRGFPSTLIPMTLRSNVIHFLSGGIHNVSVSCRAFKPCCLVIGQ